MSINIKNPEVSRKAAALAEVTGESITEAVGRAIDERLERLSHERRRGEIFKALEEIGKEVAANAPEWWLKWDYDADLYDDLGLPK